MKVLILEDHEGAQKWLADAVSIAFGNDNKITIATCIKSVIPILNHQAFDLFICDLHLPDGSGNEALTAAKQNHPDMPSIVASIYSDDDHLFPALRAGASGYLLKDDSKENIAHMLAGIFNGRPPLSPEIATRLMAHFNQDTQVEINPAEIPQLTNREQESLKYIVKGFSIKECAELMSISPHTVAGYIKDIYKKLHVSSRAEVTTEAVRLGLA